MKMTTAKSKSAPKSQSSMKKQNNFALVAGLISVLVALAMLAYFFSVKKLNTADTDITQLAYVQLKPTIIEDEGVVAQMTAAVQASEDDADWLKENEKAIYTAYKKEMETINLDTFSSKDGFMEVQTELKRRLNLTFKTDKIQAIMFTDLVLQHD
jgi:flagellar basal body-associated protein FliL